MRRKTYESNLSKLESWAKKNNVKIVFGRHGELGEYDMHTKTIIVDSRLSNEKKIFVILHECGHALVHKTIYGDRKYAVQVESFIDFSKKYTDEYKVEILREEFDAWERGVNLSRRLRLEGINYRKMKRYASSLIVEYCDWVLG